MLASDVLASLVHLCRWRRIILVTLVAIATIMLIANTAGAASNYTEHEDSQAPTNSSPQSPGTLTLTIYASKAEIQTEIEQIKAQIKDTTSEFDKEKLQERLAKLEGAVASVKAGAAAGGVLASTLDGTTEVHLYIQKAGSCGSVSFWELVRNIVRNRRVKALECENIRESGSYLGFQNIDARSRVTWSDLQPGNYVVEVYHFPGGSLDDQQFWASREYTVQAGITNSHDFVRRTQRSSLKIAVIALVVIPALVAVVFLYQLISATRTVRRPKWSADEVISQVGRYLTPIAANKESQGQWAKWLLDNEKKWMVTEQAMAEGWLVTCRSSAAGAALDPNAKQFVWVVYKDGREPRPLSPDATWLEGIRTLPPRP